MIVKVQRQLAGDKVLIHNQSRTVLVRAAFAEWQVVFEAYNNIEALFFQAVEGDDGLIIKGTPLNYDPGW